eukprot:766585-Hanusia_phi.AAC.1
MSPTPAAPAYHPTRQHHPTHDSRGSSVPVPYPLIPILIQSTHDFNAKLHIRDHFNASNITA